MGRRPRRGRCAQACLGARALAGLHAAEPLAGGRTVVAASVRPPFRADHVGSLLRPPSLKTLRADVAAGHATAAALRAAEDAAIRDAEALPETGGLQATPDSALRRRSARMDCRP